MYIWWNGIWSFRKLVLVFCLVKIKRSGNFCISTVMVYINGEILNVWKKSRRNMGLFLCLMRNWSSTWRLYCFFTLGKKDNINGPQYKGLVGVAHISLIRHSPNIYIINQPEFFHSLFHPSHQCSHSDWDAISSGKCSNLSFPNLLTIDYLKCFCKISKNNCINNIW